MCSRYFLDADGNVIAYTFTVPIHERIKKRFNIAPTQEAPIIRAGADGARAVELVRWGLVPFWSKDIKIGTRMINARSETVAEKPAFRDAFRERRCIVPASGFFEWQGEPGHKQPFAFTVADRPLFAFAGLWETCRLPEGERLETFTILTTDANDAVTPIHDRMPVILPAEALDTWLTGSRKEAQALLRPYAGPMNVRAVSKLVSNPRNEMPEVLTSPDGAPPARSAP